MRSPRFGLAVPAWAWLLIFFVAPIAMVVWFSFGYKPGIFGTHANDVLSFDRYLEALSPTFFTTFLNTLWIGVIGTLLCLLIGLPVAYWMAVKPRTFRSDATACSSACFQAPEATTGPAPVSVATDWTPLRFPRRRLRRDSERFRDESDWNMDHVFHHSVALDAIMMG